MLCSCMMTCTTFAIGPQGNGDECFDAVTATISGPNYFDTSSATPGTEPEPDESMCPGTFLNWSSSPDVWFVFTPPTTTTYTFSTCNLDGYDTSMVLYEGSCSSLVQIACNGDADVPSSDCQLYYSEFEQELMAGIEYLIRIGGYGGLVGFGELNISTSGGSAGTTWYVDLDMPGGGGTSWSDAFQTIDDALSVATEGDEIWVAEGTYYPSVPRDPLDARTVTFLIREAIGIYGGFDGTEISLEDRDLSLHHTILSGDLYGDDDSGDNMSENAYHVVSVDNIATGSLTIDGFWINGGNANTSAEKYGGGIFVDTSVSIPINIEACWLSGSNAMLGGAIGVQATSANIALLKSKISLNSASEAGGGLYTQSAASLDTCEISINSSSLGEGGALVVGGDLTVLNTTIAQNSARLIGGVSANGTTIDIANSILWGNRSLYGSTSQVNRNSAFMTARYSCIEGLEDDLVGNGNIDQNPHFGNDRGPDGENRTGDEDFTLFQGSPCIDAGDNTAVTTLLDIVGSNRFIDDPYTTDTGNNPSGNPVSDMGPYEFRPADIGQDGVRMWSGFASTVFQDVANWLPNDIPGEFDTALFNVVDTEDISLDQSVTVDILNVSGGTVKFDLLGNYLLLRNTEDAIRIGRHGTPSNLGFKSGNVYAGNKLSVFGTDNRLRIQSDATLQTNNLVIAEGGTLELSGGIIGDIVNWGGSIDIGGIDIANGIIDGNLNLLDNNRGQVLPSEIIFDIYGSSPGVGHDFLSVGQTVDLTDVTITLRYNWAPPDNQVFDLIESGLGITGTPRIMSYSGLSSYYACEWIPGSGLRGSGEATVVTAGPILFGTVQTTVLTQTPNDLVVADFDGINGPDIAISMPAVGSPATVDILLNNGMSGDVWQGFATPISVSAGSTVEDLAVGDLDNDNYPDLVVTNYDDDTVTILMNGGVGSPASFSTTTLSTDTGSGPVAVAIADFDKSDGNSLADLAVGCDGSGQTGVKIYTNETPLGLGGARGAVFNFASTWATSVPTTVDPIDVNDDKDIDIIVLSNGGNNVTVKRGDGAGNTIDFLSTPITLPTGSSAVAAVVSLLDEDDFEEFITVNNGGDALSILSSDGSSMGSPSSVTVGDEPLSIEMTDFDNDGDNDLVVSELDVNGDRQLAIIRNDSASSVVVLGMVDPVGNGSDPTLVATGDFDDDQLVDIVSVIDLAPTMRANSPAIGLYLNETLVTCTEDVNGDGNVDVTDLLAVIAAWGSDDASADLDGSGTVDVSDLLMIISAWGPC